jgi:endoglucanase
MKKAFRFIIISISTLFLLSCASNTNTNSKYSYEPVDDSDLENMSALQFTQVIGNGINLGNTFEANGAGWMGYNASPNQYETAWGQPVTTKAMFEAMKSAGLDCVRIPVAWTSTMDWRENDYEINENFMNRIKEVVGWALDSGLYVMINDHWDYGWWGLFGSDKTKAYKIFDAIWDQVGSEFKDYDYRLIFEAGNEEWGDRFNDEVDGEKGSLSVSDQYLLIHELAQHFVDKIRAQGGKNEKRFLLIPGYSTDIEKTCSSEYLMPEDSTNTVQKLLISVHYYSPALYCILEEDAKWGKVQTSWGSSSDISTQNTLLAKMTKFTDQGYGVIIGEYGVAKLKSTGEKKDGMEKWMKNVLENSDRYNYAPFLWDCNTFFKKTGTLGFTDPEIASVYKK